MKRCKLFTLTLAIQALLFAPQVMAQTETEEDESELEETTLEEVIVTGSQIKGAAIKGHVVTGCSIMDSVGVEVSSMTF